MRPANKPQVVLMLLVYRPDLRSEKDREDGAQFLEDVLVLLVF